MLKEDKTLALRSPVAHSQTLIYLLLVLASNPYFSIIISYSYHDALALLAMKKIPE